MKPILCALDFSESSFNVLKMAFDLAARFETSVTILFAYRLVQSSEGAITEFRKGVETQARQDFEALVDKLHLTDSVKYEFRSEIGFLSDRIEVCVQQTKIKMVVISQVMASSINDHKGLLLPDFIKSIKVPLLIMPE